MEQRKKSDTMEILAEEIIKSFPEFSFIVDEGIRITYLESDKEKKSKGKIVFGECEKVQDKFKWAIPADFTITFYTENVSGFTKEQMQILMEHELRHIGEKDGKFFVKPHDIEDFETILKRYGMNWSSDENKPIQKEEPAADKVIQKRIK